jgi:hypothetical protein
LPATHSIYELEWYTPFAVCLLRVSQEKWRIRQQEGSLKAAQTALEEERLRLTEQIQRDRMELDRAKVTTFYAFSNLVLQIWDVGVTQRFRSIIQRALRLDDVLSRRSVDISTRSAGSRDPKPYSASLVACPLQSAVQAVFFYALYS